MPRHCRSDSPPHRRLPPGRRFLPPPSLRSEVLRRLCEQSLLVQQLIAAFGLDFRVAYGSSFGHHCCGSQGHRLKSSYLGEFSPSLIGSDTSFLPQRLLHSGPSSVHSLSSRPTVQGSSLIRRTTGCLPPSPHPPLWFCASCPRRALLSLSGISMTPTPRRTGGRGGYLLRLQPSSPTKAMKFFGTLAQTSRRTAELGESCRPSST